MIELRNVILDYPLENLDGYSLKKALFSAFGKKKTAPNLSYRALHGISLKIEHGERIGLIGLNGAGKSTLLRLMSKIHDPSSGSVHIVGRISSLLDFSTGFEMHHTGYENIRIRLMLLGESPAAIEQKIPEIAEFSELGEFLHMPSRTYSTGMFMRLAFSTSTAIKPDILLADEVLGAGDAQFAKKAEKRIQTLLSGNRTVVVSSHSMELIEQFCDRVIWLHHGRLIADGPTQAIIKAYQEKAPFMTRLTDNAPIL